MKLLMNILIPLALAFVAGVLNFSVLSRTTAKHSYIEVTGSLKPGETFKIPLLKQVQVAAIVPGAIPWEERNVLATLRAPRAIEAGDWVMRSDIVPMDESGIQLLSKEVALNVSLEGIVLEPKLLKIGQPIGFVIRKGEVPANPAEARKEDPNNYQIVGPFRLVTLGEFASQEIDKEEDESSPRPPKTISVAVPSVDGKTLDSESQLLSQAIEQTRITAIVLYPAEKVRRPEKESVEAEKPIEEKKKEGSPSDSKSQ